MINKKELFYSFFLLLSGILLGFIVRPICNSPLRHAQCHPGGRPNPDTIMKCLTRDLDLTLEQQHKLFPIIIEMDSKLKEIRFGNLLRLDSTLDEAMEKSKIILSQQQNDKLKGIHEKLKEHFRRD